MKRPLWVIIGFVMFGLGVLSLILSLVGLRFTLLGIMYDHGVVTLILQLLMVFGGAILMFVSRIDPEAEE